MPYGVILVSARSSGRPDGDTDLERVEVGGRADSIVGQTLDALYFLLCSLLDLISGRHCCCAGVESNLSTRYTGVCLGCRSEARRVVNCKVRYLIFGRSCAWPGLEQLTSSALTAGLHWGPRAQALAGWGVAPSFHIIRLLRHRHLEPRNWRALCTSRMSDQRDKADVAIHCGTKFTQSCSISPLLLPQCAE